VVTPPNYSGPPTRGGPLHLLSPFWTPTFEEADKLSDRTVATLRLAVEAYEFKRDCPSEDVR